jgi:hypothetical protein
VKNRGESGWESETGYGDRAVAPELWAGGGDGRSGTVWWTGTAAAGAG